MNPHRSIPAVVASALLGVISAAAIVTAAFLALGAWAISASIDGAAGGIGAIAVTVIAALLFGLSVLAGWTGRDVWQGRERALPLGLMVSTITVLAAIAAIVAGDAGRSTPLLYGAIGFGVFLMMRKQMLGIRDRVEGAGADAPQSAAVYGPLAARAAGLAGVRG